MAEQVVRQRQAEQDEIEENRKIEEFAEKKRLQGEEQDRLKAEAEEQKRKAYEAIVATAELRNKEAEEYVRNK